jgi:hypothetical protein
MATKEIGLMKRVVRRRKADTRAAGELEEIHNALLALYDELTETTAWTAFVCDGICGILGERPTDVDSATHSGMRFAAIWLKQRNQSHGSTLKAACKKLREIRGK